MTDQSYRIEALRRAGRYRDDAEEVQRRADARLGPRVPQAPCDHGLFSEAARQADTVNLVAKVKTPPPNALEGADLADVFGIDLAT